jgi:DNA mismatch repair protein MutL
LAEQVSARRIRVLNPETARKIAAGEVVDRPAALAREFIDNAIDAGASTVELRIEGGGIRRLEALDDGEGMDRENLEVCWRTHATSKIASIDDLQSAATLGFRGEALAAAAASAHLEILSSTDGREAWKLEVEGGIPRLSPGHRQKGSTVRASGLFDAIPARKRFLKRESSEALLCRQALIDKALAFPGIAFRFVQDGKLRTFLPPAESLSDRFAAALLGPHEEVFLHEAACEGPGFRAVIVFGGPELFRGDRRQQMVFANGRRIQEFSLIQALEYGLQGLFPNGVHPLGAVYITIDPKLADFNIHPAKREARFRDLEAIHRAVTKTLLDFKGKFGTKDSPADFRMELSFGKGGPQERPQERPQDRPYNGHRERGDSPGDALAAEAFLNMRGAFAPLPGRGGDASDKVVADAAAAPSAGMRLAGRLFSLFILIERGDRLYIIDQHAAHERILFDRFVSGKIPAQELLSPIPFSAEGEDGFLRAKKEELADLGIRLEEDGDAWLITALPAGWHLSDSETVRELLSLKDAGSDPGRAWAASLACHAAVKDGAYLDDSTALALAGAALALPNPRCPHGRPLWAEITREQLFQAVRRTN